MKELNTAQAYDSIAFNYDSLLKDDRAVRMALWRHYQHCFKSGHRVLDVGCGTGSDALFLACQGIQITGIDASPGMIAQFQMKLKSESYNSAIKRLISDSKNSSLKAELIEAYKDMGKKDLELLEEWEQTSSEV